MFDNHWLVVWNMFFFIFPYQRGWNQQPDIILWKCETHPKFFHVHLHIPHEISHNWWFSLSVSCLCLTHQFPWHLHIQPSPHPGPKGKFPDAQRVCQNCNATCATCAGFSAEFLGPSGEFPEPLPKIRVQYSYGPKYLGQSQMGTLIL